MSPNNEDVATEENKKQEARSILRERFLRGVSELLGHPVKILTYELSTLEATFNGWKPDGSEVLVKGMITPAAVEMPSALLRSTDILAIEFKNPVELP